MTLPKVLRDLDAKAKEARQARRAEIKRKRAERKRKIRELNEKWRGYGRD